MPNYYATFTGKGLQSCTLTNPTSSTSHVSCPCNKPPHFWKGALGKQIEWHSNDPRIYSIRSNTSNCVNLILHVRQNFWHRWKDTCFPKAPWWIWFDDAKGRRSWLHKKRCQATYPMPWPSYWADAQSLNPFSNKEPCFFGMEGAVTEQLHMGHIAPQLLKSSFGCCCWGITTDRGIHPIMKLSKKLGTDHKQWNFGRSHVLWRVWRGDIWPSHMLKAPAPWRIISLRKLLHIFDKMLYYYYCLQSMFQGFPTPLGVFLYPWN